MHNYTNKEIAAILSELADLKKIKGENRYKIIAYSRAARIITDIEDDLAELVEEGRLQEIDGIGSGLSGTIREIFENGFSSELEELRTELPSGVQELINIPGIGPVRAHDFYYKLGITDVEGLKKAIQNKKIRELKGYGSKTEKKLLKFLEEYEHYQGKIFIPDGLQLARETKNIFHDDNVVERIDIAGGIRRKKESVNILVFLVSGSDNEQVFSKICDLLDFKSVLECDSDRLILQISDNLKFEIHFARKQEYVSKLIWHTGSEAHCRKLEMIAENRELNYKKDGLYKNEEKIKLDNEKDFYENLDMQYIIPELREDRGEVEEANKGTLPESVCLSDIKGDLHIHSNYSDGAYSLEEMVKACRKRGYEYMAVTDHSQSLKVAHGLSKKAVYRQFREIEKLQKKYDIKIMRGIESDILSDGSLDYEDSVLAEFDLVIASLHTGFNQEKREITYRIISAMENKYVNIIGHPHGRILGRRKPYSVDMDKIIDAAARTRTCLEINSSPYRLDLDNFSARKAKEAGVKIAINTDAHHIDELEEIELGIGVARRGWLEKNDIINTMNTDELIKYLRGE